jgi:hypothetical protein
MIRVQNRQIGRFQENNLKIVIGIVTGETEL